MTRPRGKDRQTRSPRWSAPCRNLRIHRQPCIDFGTELLCMRWLAKGAARWVSKNRVFVRHSRGAISFFIRTRTKSYLYLPTLYVV